MVLHCVSCDLCSCSLLQPNLCSSTLNCLLRSRAYREGSSTEAGRRAALRLCCLSLRFVFDLALRKGTGSRQRQEDEGKNRREPNDDCGDCGVIFLLFLRLDDLGSVHCCHCDGRQRRDDVAHDRLFVRSCGCLPQVLLWRVSECVCPLCKR